MADVELEEKFAPFFGLVRILPSNVAITTDFV
jgi:hypothetical protein